MNVEHACVQIGGRPPNLRHRTYATTTGTYRTRLYFVDSYFFREARLDSGQALARPVNHDGLVLQGDFQAIIRGHYHQALCGMRRFALLVGPTRCPELGKDMDGTRSGPLLSGFRPVHGDAKKDTNRNPSNGIPLLSWEQSARPGKTSLARQANRRFGGRQPPHRFTACSSSCCCSASHWPSQHLRPDAGQTPDLVLWTVPGSRC
jgi:hypothetical protein